MMLFPSVTMEHAYPGKFEFHYTINEDSYRGDHVEPRSGRPAVLVLGDSNTFGMGVDDGEEYAAVMKRWLSGRCDIVNMGSPGWGLTQQIRRFYDDGLAFEPSAVVLQFSSNDPHDNYENRVTTVENGEFVFHNSEYSLNNIKKILSRSPIQKSQLYNFFRSRASRAVQAWFVARKQAKDEVAPVAVAEATQIPVYETFYAELLETFAAKLDSMSIPLIMISVDGQLDNFPHIRETVHTLDQAGALNYLEVLNWLDGMSDYRSAEGHAWGARAHEVIGRELGAYVASEIVAVGRAFSN